MSYVRSGYYYWSDIGKLYYQTASGLYWPSSIYDRFNSYGLNMNNTRLVKTNTVNKHYGSSLRCETRYHTTQSEPTALIIGVCLNQASTSYSQVVTIGAIINTRRPVVSMHRLEVKPTRTPVIAARIYIRQWIRSCATIPTLIIPIPIGSE